MSLSWMLWQYTKICLESCHQLLNGVITESHLVKTYFDDATLILVTFLGTTLLCSALWTQTRKISLRRTLEEIRGRHVVYCTASSHAPSSFLKCSAPGFLVFKSGQINLTWFFFPNMKKSARYRHRCIGKGKCFDMNIWELDMNIGNLIYKCIVDTWNWQSWYFVTFGQAYTGQSYPSFEQLHGCTSLNFFFFLILKLSSMFPLETRDKTKKGEWFKNFYQENYFM